MRVRLSRQAAEYVACLPPNSRRRVRAALTGLQQENGDVLALTEPLQGYYRCRVGAHRIVFRYEPGPAIFVPLIERRPVVYQVLAELLKAELG